MPTTTSRRRRAATAGAALLAALALGAAGCGPDGPARPATAPLALPRSAPTSLGDLTGWKVEDWDRYVADSAFAGDAAPGFWTAARMDTAKPRPTPEYSLTAPRRPVSNRTPRRPPSRPSRCRTRTPRPARWSAGSS